MPNRPYHRRFANFHPRTLAATDALFRSKPWRGTDAEKRAKFETWLQAASAVYGVPTPTLRITGPAECFIHGCYDQRSHKILLPKYSVSTLFHEFRHHLQTYGIAPRVRPEDDARAWSLSLFYRSRPTLFRRAVERGTILFTEDAR